MSALAPAGGVPQIYIGFCRGTGLFSRVISRFTKGGPSHSFLAWYDEWWGGAVSLGSEGQGWIYLPAERMANVSALYRMSRVDLWCGLRTNRARLGTRYDFEGLLGMGWVMLCWHWLKRRVRNPLESRSAWFCSEAIAQVLRDSGAPVDLPPGETDPARLEAEIRLLGAEQISWPGDSPW